ncbi:MAG: DNA-packaging protein [Oscillospiraceae bacterium]|nr:DNA-packaging protein [Oscillospiraceae bacterium]
MQGRNNGGRPRKYKTPEELWEKWLEYRDFCDNQMVLTHDFSAKNSEFVSAELRRAITYTIEGFCDYLDLSRASYYDYYCNNKRFADVATRIREICEIDVRRKFELGVIPPNLAALWMSKYGYSTRTESRIDGAVPVALIDDLGKGEQDGE